MKTSTKRGGFRTTTVLLTLFGLGLVSINHNSREEQMRNRRTSHEHTTQLPSHASPHINHNNTNNHDKLRLHVRLITVLYCCSNVLHLLSPNTATSCLTFSVAPQFSYVVKD